MKNYLNKGLNCLLYGNYFVGFCAIAQALYTYSYFSINPDASVCAFLFFSTLAYYNFCLLISKPTKNLYLANNRLNWFFTHYNINFGVTVFASIVLIPLIWTFNYEAKVLVFVLITLSAGYNFPFNYLNGKTIALRNIKGLKLFLIAFVWALSVVLLPVVASGVSILKTTILILLFKQFLLFIAITIPFDVRDYLDDKALNLKTLPIIYGIKKAYAFAIILLLVNVFIVLLFNDALTESLFFASILTPILAIFVILNTGLRKHTYYYFLYLDGVLIVEYLFLTVFNLFK